MIPSIMKDDWIAPLVYLFYITFADIIPISAQLVSILVVLNQTKSRIQYVSRKLEISDKFSKKKRKFTFKSNDSEKSH